MKLTNRTLWSLLLVVALSGAMLSACSGRQAPPATSEVITTATPEPPKLSTPEDAVKSYLDWISFSYRTGSSEISSPTMTPEEGVRVDSYIELNRQKGQFLDQSVAKFKVRDVKIKGKKATVTASEDWVYRYVVIVNSKPGPKLNASYETTYTLKKQGENWVVESVEASATTPVK